MNLLLTYDSVTLFEPNTREKRKKSINKYKKKFSFTSLNNLRASKIATVKVNRRIIEMQHKQKQRIDDSHTGRGIV